jgi:uncharacterized membrane protein YfcA
VEIALVSVVAFVASLLTFFTGFGLGTLLLPAFAVFFPADVAVALTAVVHFLNSLFKLVLVGRRANVGVALRFGAPAVAAAFAGAWALTWLSDLPLLFAYELGGRDFEVTPIAFVIAILMVAFAALELSTGAKRLSVAPRYLPLGGLVTGFFGGLSGHQGALRSAFLLRAGLDKEAFVATGVVVAAAVDLTRLAVYATSFATRAVTENGLILAIATAAAFAGAFLGNRALDKISLRSIEIGVAILLTVVAVGMGSGAL